MFRGFPLLFIECSVTYLHIPGNQSVFRYTLSVSQSSRLVTSTIPHRASITSATFLVETPCTYISAMAGFRPRSNAEG